MKDLIKTYLELGRAPGAMSTAFLAVVGAYTSSGSPEIAQLLLLILIGVLSHFSVGALNEIMDRKIDASAKELSHKPLVSGRASIAGAFMFVISAAFAAILLSAALFGALSVCFLVLSIGISAIYDIWGKYTKWAYDFVLSAGCTIFVFYGAVCVGKITELTLFAAPIVFLGLSAGQWYAGMKDVETDRQHAVPTTAVRWGYTHSKPLTVRDNNILYIIGIKAGIVLILASDFIIEGVDSAYHTAIVFFYIIGEGALLLSTLGKQSRGSFLTLTMANILLAWLAITSPLAERLGAWLLVLFALPVLWVVAINRLLYGQTLKPKL